MIEKLFDIRNSVDFYLRNKFSFSRKNFVFKNECKDKMFSSKEEQDIEKELFEKYSLIKMKNFGTRQNYLENLDILYILDKYFDIEKSENLKILDIGSKSWNYAKAEYYFFQRHCNNLEVTGLEIDPNRLNTEFYSRKQIALANIKGLKSTRYIGQNLLNHSESYDIITWFLPFVFQNPHKCWGLPIKHFKPEEMLVHCLNILNKNGRIFITNQGEIEHLEQIRLCKKLNLNFEKIGKISNHFNFYPKDRYAIVIKN